MILSIISLIKARIKFYLSLAAIASLYFFGSNIDINSIIESVKTQLAQFMDTKCVNLDPDAIKDLDSIKQQIQQFLDQSKK